MDAINHVVEEYTRYNKDQKRTFQTYRDRRSMKSLNSCVENATLSYSESQVIRRKSIQSRGVTEQSLEASKGVTQPDWSLGCKRSSKQQDREAYWGGIPY